METWRQMKPFKDRVLVEFIKEETTEGGLFIPSGAEEPPVRGRVLLSGPGRKVSEDVRLPPTCKVGDIVFFRPKDGEQHKALGDNRRVIRHDQVMGVIEA